MKKLNITKKQYDESKYFTNKYGALKFVSESGNLYKTDKGVVIALESAEKTDESLADIGKAIGDTVKGGAEKVKAGIKKGAKAVGNFFKGNFRPNDQVEISGGQDSDGNPVSLSGVVKDANPKEVTIAISRQAAESDEEGAGEGGEDVTRGELTDMLKDVVDQVEKVCDSQDISFEEVIGVEPEGESDDEADKDEVVATKDEVADALVDVIDTVKDIADKNDIELPEEEEKDDDEGGKDDDDEKRDGEFELNEEGTECAGGKCECSCGKVKTLESVKARRRARVVREAIARRARLRKIRESIARRAKARKVMESIRKRRAAKKVMESIRRRRAAKKVMESRKARASRRLRKG